MFSLIFLLCLSLLFKVLLVQRFKRYNGLPTQKLQERSVSCGESNSMVVKMSVLIWFPDYKWLTVWMHIPLVRKTWIDQALAHYYIYGTYPLYMMLDELVKSRSPWLSWKFINMHLFPTYWKRDDLLCSL